MYVLVTLLFIFAQATQALPLKPCEALLRAEPIDRTHQQVYPAEMESAGIFTRPDELLPKFDTGFFLYLITANGDVLTAPKYHPKYFPRGLATHKSLLQMYVARIRGAEMPDIVAAGEFQIAFDEVVQIRNKSGNFRGTPASLDLAVEIFTLHGLPITPRTMILPVSAGTAEDMGHTPQDRDQDGFRLQVMTDVYRSPRGRILHDIYIRMFALLRESFPETKGRDLIKRLMDAQAEGASFTGNYDGYQTFYYPLQTAFSPDGFEYGIWATENLPDHGGADGFSEGAAKQLANFIIGAQDRLSLRLRTKWQRLVREFAQIGRL